jgi:hypothetical protein
MNDCYDDIGEKYIVLRLGMLGEDRPLMFWIM